MTVFQRSKVESHILKSPIKIINIMRHIGRNDNKHHAVHVWHSVIDLSLFWQQYKLLKAANICIINKFHNLTMTDVRHRKNHRLL